MELPSSKARMVPVVMKTIAVFGSCILVGWSFSMLAISMLDIEQLYGVDTKTVSTTFTGFGFGNIAGSIMVGCIYDKLNEMAQLSIATFFSTVSIVIATWMPSFMCFVTMVTVQGICLGYIMAAIFPYLLTLWEKSKAREPLVQSLEVVWSLGAAIGPIIMEPFLNTAGDAHGGFEHGLFSDADITAMELKSNLSDEHLLTNQSETTLSLTATTTTIGSLENTYLHSNATFSSPTVCYGFLTYGCVNALICCLCVFCYFLFEGFACKRKSIPKSEDEVMKNGYKKRVELPTYTKILLYGLLLVYFFLESGLETVISSMLAPFALVELNMAKEKISLLSFMFWLGEMLGRIAGIPLCKFLSPTQMIVIDLVLLNTAYLMMALLVHLHPIVMWFALPMAGLGTSTLWPSAFLWAADFLPVSGFIGSIVIIGTSAGMMSMPVFAGYLFQTFCPISIVYLCLGSGILMVIVFICMKLLAHFLIPLNPKVVVEDDISAKLNQTEEEQLEDSINQNGSIYRNGSLAPIMIDPICSVDV